MAFDMNAIHARTIAKRAAAGLIADDGIACATQAEKAYRDFRVQMKARNDWGNLPADLERRLDALRAAYRAA